MINVQCFGCNFKISGENRDIVSGKISDHLINDKCPGPCVAITIRKERPDNFDSEYGMWMMGGYVTQSGSSRVGETLFGYPTEIPS